MRRFRIPLLAPTLLLAIFAWGGLGVGVVDAVLFHRVSLAAAAGDLPSTGDGAGLAGHAAACVLEQPLPTARPAVPPALLARVPVLAFVPPVAGGEEAPRPPRLDCSLQSRAPPPPSA